jgi:hypothetical protein
MKKSYSASRHTPIWKTKVTSAASFNLKRRKEGGGRGAWGGEVVPTQYVRLVMKMMIETMMMMMMMTKNDDDDDDDDDNVVVDDDDADYDDVEPHRGEVRPVASTHSSSGGGGPCLLHLKQLIQWCAGRIQRCGEQTDVRKVSCSRNLCCGVEGRVHCKLHVALTTANLRQVDDYETNNRRMGSG